MGKKLEIFNKIMDMLIVGIFTYTAGVIIESQILNYVCIGFGALCIIKLCGDLIKIINNYKK